MNYSDIEILVQNDESKIVEFKKTIGELKDAMRSACAFATSYLESWGTGFQRMQEFCKMQGLQVPQLEVKENRIVITFVRENINGQLNESQRETFNYVKMHEGCNTTMISEGLGKPFRTIDKHILFLLKYGYIERRGSKKNGGFYVKCSDN